MYIYSICVYMETWMIIASLALSFALGIGSTYIFFFMVQKQATSLYMQAKGARGQAVKQEKDSQLLLMLQDAGDRFKAAKESGEDMKAFIPKILIEVGTAHPMGAMRFGGELKKLVEKFSLGDLE